ncbi:MAG: hypothetical protein VW835_17265 [Rickettsiales bacterium]
MPHGKLSVSDEIRSELLNILIGSRAKQNSLFEKYQLNSEKINDITQIKSNNNTILLWEIIYFVSSGILSGRNTSVSDIYLSLGVSKSTAIRCVTLLDTFGIFEKSRDPSDRRRAVIALSREFRKNFIEYLDAILSQLDEMTKLPRDPLA